MYKKMSRASRLRRGADFARVYREGSRVRGRLILLVAAPSSYPPVEGSSARLGVSVGKRLHRHAVVRNRVKRVFRAAFREILQEIPALDLILIPVAPPSEYRMEAVRDELVTLLGRVERKMEKGRAC